MAELDKEIADLKEEIKGHNNDLKVAISAQERSDIRNLITSARETLNRLMDRRAGAGGGADFAPTTSAVTLRDALLSAKEENGFLCLSGGEVFPVSKGRTDVIPSKLLIREFHGEMQLILEQLRKSRSEQNPNDGAIFFGPSGTGKTWASMAVLVNELKEAQKTGKCVVFFDCPGQRAVVFSKHRNVYISDIDHPNVRDIPELADQNTVLIYDASRGEQKSLAIFDCETLIFASPNAGNFRQFASVKGLIRFVCPSWTLEELQQLEHGYGDRFLPDEVRRRFEQFGGSPRAVIANSPIISETQEADASRLLLGTNLWSDRASMSEAWPSSLLMATYSIETRATTAEEAFDKYVEKNVLWTYINERIMELVHQKYEFANETFRLVFEGWLKSEPKAAALHGHWFQYEARKLFIGAKPSDVEWKALQENEGLTDAQQRIVNTAFAGAQRDLTWTFPPSIRVMQAANIERMGKEYKMEQLLALKQDRDVMYRLPQGFPLIDFYNPPNNLFSCGVGDHKINLAHAKDLCDKFGKEMQLNFVFATTSSNYGKVQRWQSFESGKSTLCLGKLPESTVYQLARFVQYGMRFKKS